MANLSEKQSMSDFDKYFTKPEKKYYHPKLNFWKNYLDCGFNSEIEIRRERDGLIFFKPTIMLIHFYGQENYCDDELWDPDLNHWCVESGIKAIDLDNESLRFSLAFKDEFRKPEDRFGDGVFNRMLLHVIDNSPFKQHESVSDVRKDIHRGNPTFNSQTFNDCSEMTEFLIQERALELVEKLCYKKDKAIDILAGALGKYLDERFSVTSRRLMGFSETNRRLR